MSKSLQDVDILYEKLMKDMAEGSTEAIGGIILMYLTSAFELGEEARERDLRSEWRVRDL